MILPLVLGAVISVELRPAVDGLRCEVSGFRTGATVIELDRPVVLEGAAATVAVPGADPGADLVPLARGCWIEAVSAGQTVAEAWPEAAIAGSWSVPPKSDPPASIAASFLDAAAVDAKARALRCEVSDRAWRCAVPARRPMHVKLELDRFAPVHLWDVQARDGAVVDTGMHDLFVGGCVAGRVTDARGRPLQNAAVAMAAATSAEQPSAERVLTRYTARTDAKGIFRFAAVAEGGYRIRSVVPKRSDAVLEHVEVRPGDDIELESPLVHLDPAELEVVVSPSRAGGGKPWRVRLKRPGARLHELVTAAEGVADEGGLWRQDGLQAGAYELYVLDESGSEVERRAVDLRGGRERISIVLSGITVRGRVTAGEKGLAARIQFDSGRQRVKTSSDADGAFEAFFPSEGKWKPAISIGSAEMQIVLDDVEIRRDGDDELLLALPAGRVRGRVVDGEGRGVRAVVSLGRDRRGVAQGLTADDGTFDIIGLEPGHYAIAAEGEEGVAGPLPMAVGEKEAEAVELRIGRWNELRGSVITAAGAPASGAVVRLFYESTSGFEDVIADARGMFSFQMRPGVPFADVIVLAPPHPIAILRIDARRQGKDRLTIQLARDGAKLRLFPLNIPPWPTVTGPDGISRSLRLMLMPLLGGADWQERFNGGFQLTVTPGPYVVCVAPGQCQKIDVATHSVAVADFITPRPKEARP